LRGTGVVEPRRKGDGRVAKEEGLGSRINKRKSCNINIAILRASKKAPLLDTASINNNYLPQVQ